MLGHLYQVCWDTFSRCAGTPIADAAALNLGMGTKLEKS